MTFLALLRKELRAYFVSPLVYVVAAVFYALTGFFFYTQLIYFVQYGFGFNILGNFWVAFLAGAPYSLSMVLLLVVPLLTMRLMAEERKLGTIELLLTYPLRDATIVAAKFTACSLVLALLLAGTLAYPAFLAAIQPLPWQPIVASYLGLLLLGVSFTACGLFVSSLTESQVVAAVGTLGVLVLFWAVSWNEAATSPPALRAAAQLAMFDHFETFAKGVVDGGDLAYFIAVSAFFTFCTLRVLEARHWRGQR
jgi:gliding motility-associated transport system permease protein